MAATAAGGGAQRKSKDLFVGNLAPSCSEKDLILLFKAYGTVERVDYIWHKSGPSRGQPKGYAFVEFVNEAQSSAALKALDGKLIRGRRLAIRYSARDLTAQTGQHQQQSETGKRGRDEEADVPGGSNKKASTASSSSSYASSSSEPSSSSSSSLSSIEMRIRKLQEALKSTKSA